MIFGGYLTLSGPYLTKYAARYLKWTKVGTYLKCGVRCVVSLTAIDLKKFRGNPKVDE